MSVVMAVCVDVRFLKPRIMVYEYSEQYVSDSDDFNDENTTLGGLSKSFSIEYIRNSYSI